MVGGRWTPRKNIYFKAKSNSKPTSEGVKSLIVCQRCNPPDCLSACVWVCLIWQITPKRLCLLDCQPSNFVSVPYQTKRWFFGQFRKLVMTYWVMWHIGHVTDKTVIMFDICVKSSMTYTTYHVNSVLNVNREELMNWAKTRREAD